MENSGLYYTQIRWQMKAEIHLIDKHLSVTLIVERNTLINHHIRRLL